MDIYKLPITALEKIETRLERYKETPFPQHMAMKWALDRVRVCLNNKAYYGVDYVPTH